MKKSDMLGGSATFDAVNQPMSSRAAAFARFSGQESPGDDDAAAKPSSEGLRLPVAKLAHNPENPREELQDIEDLADSLAARGLIQPVAVVTRAAFLSAHPGHEQNIGDAEYVVVDGNRRLAAANMAGLDEVPAHLDDSFATNADVLLENALVAAIHNHDLEPIDQAKALQTLVEKYGSQRQVAKALNKSSGWVTQRMALLKLTPELQQAVEEKTLPVEVARQVGQLPQQQQHGAAQEALAARAEAKKRRKRQPAAAQGAYAVSTQKASTESTDNPMSGEPTGPTGAYAVSTLKPETVRPGDPGLETGAPTDTEVPNKDGSGDREGSATDTPTPWREGPADMDATLAALTPEQRTRFLHRYIERSGSTAALAEDLTRGLSPEKRLQLATILGEVSERMREL
ncbi:ParB/RepB/Spo0J family partition protein [Streptomyces sp. NBC_00892]|uniref:ParB/RepB/Spo0J family partition protein n=1 Tax=Streptomyces sp. NBC_00892 TaxID=2975861 RepID=UPI00225BFE6F|nr:ParB/RepB/Spo0J family partition protein [Streptomyces sp. NBC_00892]MCX4902377.1 ParB/RepB/Spo0J family partition protein [Streptomyces sp. NBC_00892]